MKLILATPFLIYFLFILDKSYLYVFLVIWFVGIILVRSRVVLIPAHQEPSNFSLYSGRIFFSYFIVFGVIALSLESIESLIILISLSIAALIEAPVISKNK